MRVRDKVVVVTGGGSGIGRQLVLDLLERGARVAALDIRQQSLHETSELSGSGAGDRLSTHVIDVSDRDAVQGVPERVIASHGAVDAVIHNAGIIQPFVRFVDLDYSAIDKVVDVNLYGTIHIAKAFLPQLVARPEAHLAIVSSAACFLPLAGQAFYGATKASVKLLTEGLYAELLETNVSVSAVFPGSVATDIASNSGVDMGERFESDGRRSQATTAEDAAQIILNGIENRRLHIHVGRDAQLLHLANRVAPKLATHLIYKQMKDLLPSREPGAVSPESER